MKEKVVGKITFATSGGASTRFNTPEGAPAVVYLSARKCPRCDTELVVSPLIDHKELRSTFYFVLADFCPKCDSIKTCKECGHSRIVRDDKINGRVVKLADTQRLGRCARTGRVGSTPSVPTKKKGKK